MTVTTVPPPDHTAYRLTTADEAKIIQALEGACNEWRAQGGTPRETTDLPTLLRLGAHSIGCSLHDLRDSEIDWIEERAKEAIAR